MIRDGGSWAKNRGAVVTAVGGLTCELVPRLGLSKVGKQAPVLKHGPRSAF